MKRWLLPFLGIFLFSSCLPKPLPTKEGDIDWGVDITWHGHSCFSLTDSIGRTVVIDPFDDTVGYGDLNLRADALLITHDHFDHNNKRAVRARLNSFDTVESTGTWTVAGGLKVFGISSNHDMANGDIHGKNNIYVFSLGGLRFAHFGDFGQKNLSKEQLEAIGNIDVLFIPVGGVTTIDAPRASQIVQELKPKAVFPMHYGNTRFYPLNSVEQFKILFSKEQLINLTQSGIRLRKAQLTDPLSVYTLIPTPRNN